MKKDRAAKSRRRLEQRPEPGVIEWKAVDIREDLHAERAELRHRPLELGDTFLGVIERQRRDEPGEPMRVRLHRVGHRIVRQASEVDGRLPIGVDRFDRRRRQRQHLAIVRAEFLEAAEAHVEIVKERNMEPPFDRAAVDDDFLQTLEKSFREDVIEDVDLETHAESWPVTREASCFGSDGGALPRHATCRSGRSRIRSRP